jgi:hypothetical protein
LPALPRAGLFGATSVNNAYFSNISRATVARYFIPVFAEKSPGICSPKQQRGRNLPKLRALSGTGST